MKTPIRRLDSLTHNDTAATKLINDNFEALQQGVEDALSRSGKKPNFMDDVLDMNMHRIINIADPVDDYDLANKHYVDTKVSEEETRAKAAEAEEETARIAGDNALRRLIDDEKTARQNADNAIINSIGDATITFSQGGVVKGTISTNQKTNATIDLDAGGSGSGGVANSIIIRNIAATSFSNTPATSDVPAIYFAHIDVSAYVEDGKKYMPFVVYESDGGSYSRLDIIQNMASDCYYQYGSKKVSLRFYNEDVWHSAKYNVFLLEVEDDTNYAIRGMTNGLDGIATTDRAIHIEHMPATYVHTSTIDSAHIDVSSYVEEGKAYIPVIATEGVTSAGYFERISSLKGTCLYDIEHESVSLYFTNDYHRQVAACFSVTLIPVDYHPSHPDNKLCDGVTDGAGGMQNAENLVTSISSSSTDTQYPSAKCVYDIIGDVETLINAL